MKKEHLTFLHNQEEEINNNMKKIRESDDLYKTATYKSRSAVRKKYWRSLHLNHPSKFYCK